MIVRRRIDITGVVQGVGFRPFVYRCATKRGLVGLVGNSGDGVFVEVQGDSETIAEFERDLTSPPPLAIVDSQASRDIPLADSTQFEIVESQRGTASTFVSPDLDVCADCVFEMRDGTNRRAGYPFITCTNCGPRFTITIATPYDRPTTTMASFTMCDRCQREYDDPGDRRFHAQPNACADCGPRVVLESADHHADPIAGARAIVAAGGAVAVKGIGGFHLACDARNDAAVMQLRARKQRPSKPFAVMVPDLATARTLAHLSEAEESALTSPRRPIVLVDPVAGTLAPAVAPGLGRLGLMLPSSPLHRLLLKPGDAWVMTSGNLSSEPIIIDNDDARDRLATIADAFLLHDRPIHVPCDDSVVRIHDGLELPIRRSRGYAPLPVKLAFDTTPVLAVGGELKATFCVASGRDAFMSQHIGDMENLETLQAFERAVEHMQALFAIDPEVLVADLHPNYLSAGWAERVAEGRPVIRVQHHEAHIAAVMTEHRFRDAVVGLSFDGTGYGHDGTIWGGEILVGDLRGFERVGHLAPVPLAGGDASVRRPYRMALAHLHTAGIAWEGGIPAFDHCPDSERKTLAHQLTTGLGCVSTTSMGRLFDAAAALSGVCAEAGYEGQAAMELEAVADPEETGAYSFDLDDAHILDPAPAWQELLADVSAGVAPGAIATRFHRGLAASVARAAVDVAAESGIGTIALSGGVFQNVSLLSEVSRIVNGHGLRVLSHRVVPPNDGGLALGQMALAAHRME